MPCGCDSTSTVSPIVAAPAVALVAPGQETPFAPGVEAAPVAGAIAAPASCPPAWLPWLLVAFLAVRLYLETRRQGDM